MRLLFAGHPQCQPGPGVSYAQAALQAESPVMWPSAPWEDYRLNLYGSVLFNQARREYEMFYQCGNALRVARAVSADGRQWTRPPVTLARWENTHIPEIRPWPQAMSGGVASDDASAPGSAEPEKLALTLREQLDGFYPSNLVAGLHMPTVVYEPESNMPYRMLAFDDSGFVALHAREGHYFEAMQSGPVIPLLTWKNESTGKIWCSDVATCRRAGPSAYTGYIKTYELDAAGRSRRCIGSAESTNFIDWTPVQTIWSPGAAEDAIAQQRGFKWADFYGMCSFEWGAVQLAFLWLFQIDRELPNGTHYGKMEVFLARSLDGQTWSRVSDRPFIPWDLNYGPAGGMVTTATAPIEDGKDLLIWYSDSNYEHGFAEKDFSREIAAPAWVIRHARLPAERLLGLSASEGRVELNPPLQIAEREDGAQYRKLRLNLDCRGGEVLVEFGMKDNSISTLCWTDLDSTEAHAVIPREATCILGVRLQGAVVYAMELLP